jgi:deoxyadenosine/deoxycytidine kinase
VQDRTIYEDAHIFAPNLHSMGLMSSRDFENYFSLFKLMSSLVQPPDLVIYLRASVAKLVAQIQKRGRQYENSIRLDYLKGLNQQYEEWVANYTEGRLLIVNIDEHDFENNPEDLSYIIDRINGELNGLFIRNIF